jgi:NAD+ synthase (glutamine-hydrolysing)
MRTLRLALAQTNTTVGGLESNTSKVLEYIEKAKALHADIVAFPEMTITGYPPEDLLFKTSFLKANISKLEEISKASQGITVIVGFVDVEAGIYNAAAILRDGQLLGKYHKVHLPNYGVFDEKRYFKTGSEYPIFVINNVNIGINICEDIWYPDGPAYRQASSGAEVIVNINASPYHIGKRDERENMLVKRSRENQVYIAYVNLIGGQDELVFDGASTIFDYEGKLLARASQMREDLVLADLDLDALTTYRINNTIHRKEDKEMPRLVYTSPSNNLTKKPAIYTRIEKPLDELAEIYAALVTGTKDYVHKNGFEKVIIGLSGGIDSSLTAAIAVDALGSENVLGVAMPSKYSSDGSITDSRDLSDNLGIGLSIIPIEQAVNAMTDSLSNVFHNTKIGVAEENLQARIRGNLLMAISNKFGWLVLTTGNKSETAVGYTTLYGDMAGGFAAIKDVPKTLVYKLTSYRNANGVPSNVIPVNVIDKKPSAELRANQTDQDTLPPYDILDSILEAYVENELSYAEIINMGFDSDVVYKIINLVDRNEYKRRQAAPGVKITPLAFGRDRRLPIVNQYNQF